MEYVFYADVFWLQNSLMNGIVLLIAARLRKRLFLHSFWKAFLIAALGGMGETILLCITSNYRLFLVLSHVIVIPCMVFAFFGKSHMKLFLQNIILCYAFTFFLGGVITTLENTFRIHQIPILTVIFGIILAEGLIRYSYRIIKKQKKIFPVKLRHGDSEVSCDGFWDSGNLLVEPYQKRPVHIVSKDIKERLSLEDKDYIGVIPFRTLGMEYGSIEIFQIDHLFVYEMKKLYAKEQIVVAVANDELFLGKSYRMIFHSAIFEDI